MYRHHDGAEAIAATKVSPAQLSSTLNKKLSYRKETVRPLHNIEIRVLL